ncbi:MAG: hypothetical protein GY789_08745 [Hyphomicrobiales bacterium]|nr:hypothetical protein [Hyphomicrobiales bacterium]MCP4997819.1 hypothetical protein [Hyphomicrobiales bacterium]
MRTAKLGVLNQRLNGYAFIMGDNYTIADLATWPWIRAVVGFYEAGEQVGMDNFQYVIRWSEICSSRPASEAAVNIPSRG